jgi:hypothetical protein
MSLAGRVPENTMPTTHEIAHAAGMDIANALMRAAVLPQWTEDDYNAAVAEYHRVNPCPADVPCELCHPSTERTP